jgi:surfeit locus 1 family protein
VKRFPIGLTVCTIILLAILVRLGLWQMSRLHETQAKLARIAALRTAPAQPLDKVISAGSAGLDHVRVSVRCAPSVRAGPQVFRYALPGGAIGWRLLGVCRVAGRTFDAVLLDRGLVTSLSGQMAPRAMSVQEPVDVVGVLRAVGRKPMFGDTMETGAPGVRVVRVIDPAALESIARASGASAPLPYFLAVESETPPPAGLTPAPVTEDTPRDNFGYALTWFGLAGALACVYLAMLWRRTRA